MSTQSDGVCVLRVWSVLVVLLPFQTKKRRRETNLEIMVEYDENTYTAELKKKPICRFCLSQEDALTNIYSTSNTNSQVALSMQIMACVSIEVIYCVLSSHQQKTHRRKVSLCLDFVHENWRYVSAFVSPHPSPERKTANPLRSRKKTTECIYLHGFFPSGKLTIKQEINAECSCQAPFGCMYWES